MACFLWSVLVLIIGTIAVLIFWVRKARPNQGHFWIKEGLLVEKVASYQKAIALDPDDAAAYNGLGVVLNEEWRFDEAELSFRRAIQLDPDAAGFHNNLGSVLTAQKRLDEAEASLRKAVELDPDLAEARKNLERLRAEIELVVGYPLNNWP